MNCATVDTDVSHEQQTTSRVLDSGSFIELTDTGRTPITPSSPEEPSIDLQHPFNNESQGGRAKK